MESMNLTINGEPQASSAETLGALVETLGMKPDRVAIELNREIVPRDQWPQTPLHDGDRLEIVHFVGGHWSRGTISRFSSMATRSGFMPRVSTSAPRVSADEAWGSPLIVSFIESILAAGSCRASLGLDGRGRPSPREQGWQRLIRSKWRRAD